MTVIGLLAFFAGLHIIFFMIITAGAIMTECEDYLKFGKVVIAHIIASVIASLLAYAAYSCSYDLNHEGPKHKISIDDYLPIVGAKYECIEVKGKVYKIKVNVYSSMSSSEIEVPKDTYDSLAIGSIYFKGEDKVASYVIPINGTVPVKKE